MNESQLIEFVPAVLDHLYPSAAEPYFGDTMWRFRRGDVVSLVSVHSGNDNPHYIRIHSGVAIDVPFGAEVALEVARFNRDLWNGRAFMQATEDPRCA